MACCARMFSANTYRRKAEQLAGTAAAAAVVPAVKASDVTAEGVFGEYFFETGVETQRTFATSHEIGISRNPMTGQVEHWVMVGLNSKYDGDGVRVHGRPPASVVFCIDVSGSMSVNMALGEPPKMDVAKESLVDLLGRLRDEDEVGIVSFNVNARVVVPLTKASMMDKAAVREAIMQLEENGGTDLSAGFREAAKMLECRVGQEQQRELRIVFATDMAPNLGEFSAEGLFGLAEKCAAKNIFSTFLGIGLDFDTDLVERVSAGVRGSSCHAIKNAVSFARKMARDFEYSVFPIVFDVAVRVQSSGFKLLGGYGSPEATKPAAAAVVPPSMEEVHVGDHATAAGAGAVAVAGTMTDALAVVQQNPREGMDLLKVGTLFPSAKEEGGMTHGGIFMIKMQPNQPAPSDDGTVVQDAAERRRLEIISQFRDRAGDKFEERDQVVIPENTQLPYFGNLSVRKAILLCHFVDAVQLHIRSPDTARLAAFAQHFKSESDAIQDKALEKDYRALLNLLESPDRAI